MGVAAALRFALTFLMLMSLGLGLSVPAVDIPETPYDESESAPYEITPLLSIALRLGAAPKTQPPLRSLHLKGDVPSSFPPTLLHDADARRSADARVSLALLRTLLC